MKGAFYYNFLYSFIPRKPLFFGRLVNNVVKAKVMSKKILRYVDVCASTKCNLRCAHCFATSFERTDQQPLSLKEWRDVARQCMKLGAATFGITGGEPLLYKDLQQLVGNLFPRKNLITVNSNATLLTDRQAKDLYRAGLDVFQFSMDSFNPQEHDRFRGKNGTHQKLMNAIGLAQKNRLKVTLVCTVSHQTIRTEGVKGVIDFAKKLGILVILSRATPAGEWLGREDILLTKDDQEYMYELVRKFSHVRTDMDTNFGPYGCSAASEKIYITSFGDVIPCPFMHISFGNVRNDSVEAIRNRMLSIPRLNCYSRTCHVAEDSEFINDVLTKTFRLKKLIDWKDCF